MITNCRSNRIATGLMSLVLVWITGCAYVEDPGGPAPGWVPPGPPGVWVPPGAPPRPPHGGGAYVGTDRGSWQAWHNVMPGPRPATLHIEGVVTVSASNLHAELRRRPSVADALHYEVRITRVGDFGAQVLTRRPVSLIVPYGGGHGFLAVHLPDGERLRLGITRAY